MIKFREYSQVKGLDIERYYSEYLEQREYGFLGDLGKKITRGAKKLALKPLEKNGLLIHSTGLLFV